MNCSEKMLTERFRNHVDTNEVSFEWLKMAHHPNDFIINTDDKTEMQIVK